MVRSIALENVLGWNSFQQNSGFLWPNEDMVRIVLMVREANVSMRIPLKTVIVQWFYTFESKNN